MKKLIIVLLAFFLDRLSKVYLLDLQSAGIDIDFYTPIFVMSRITGWSAHIMEQHTSNKLIRPLSKYKGKEVREVMLLNQR